VIAIPPPSMLELAIDGANLANWSMVASMPHASVVSVSLGYPCDAIVHSLDGTGLAIPSGARCRALAVLFASSVFTGRAPADHVLITAMAGGVRHPDLGSESDDDIGQLIHDDLQSLLGIRAPPVLAAVTRWPNALPQALPGNADRLSAADSLEAESPRLALAGGWRDGSSVSEAMSSGYRAADRLHDRAESS